MSLKTLISSIGHFFANLFAHTKEDFNNLPVDQKDAVIKGVNVSQIIKEGYASGKDELLTAIETKAGLTATESHDVVLAISKDLGLDTQVVDDAAAHIADKAQAAITDNGWNALWQDVAQFAASYLSTGKLNWITLGLGVIEWAYQHFLKGVQ